MRARQLPAMDRGLSRPQIRPLTSMTAQFYRVEWVSRSRRACRTARASSSASRSASSSVSSRRPLRCRYSAADSAISSKAGPAGRGGSAGCSTYVRPPPRSVVVGEYPTRPARSATRRLMMISSVVRVVVRNRRRPVPVVPVMSSRSPGKPLVSASRSADGGSPKSGCRRFESCRGTTSDDQRLSLASHNQDRVVGTNMEHGTNARIFVPVATAERHRTMRHFRCASISAAAGRRCGTGRRST